MEYIAHRGTIQRSGARMTDVPVPSTIRLRSLSSGPSYGYVRLAREVSNSLRALARQTPIAEGTAFELRISQSQLVLRHLRFAKRCV